MKKHKGEKMSLRKGLALLLLTAFSLSSIVVPANATTLASGLLNGQGIPTTLTVVQKPGNTTTGGNEAVVPVQVRMTIPASILQVNAPQANYVNGNDFGIGADGDLLTTTGGSEPVNPSVIIIKAPRAADGTNTITGQFVKAQNYVEVNTVQDYGDIDGAALLSNVTSVTSTASLPGSAGGGNGTGLVIQAAVITATANTARFGTNLDVQPGDIVVYITRTETTGTFTNSGQVILDITGMALAVDPSSTPVTTGDISGLLEEPLTGGISGNGGDVRSALTDTTNNQAVKVAQLGAGARLTAVNVGEADGNFSAGAARLSGNSQTVFASQVTGTTLNVQPGFTGPAGAITHVDPEILMLAGAELAESDATTQFFHSGFDTTAINITGGVQTESAGNAVLTGLDPASSSIFPNTSNALYTFQYTLEDSNGSASAASFELDRVDFEFPTGRCRYPGCARGTGNIVAATELRDGILGALFNIADDAAGGDVDAIADFGALVIADQTVGASANLLPIDGQTASYTNSVTGNAQTTGADRVAGGADGFLDMAQVTALPNAVTAGNNQITIPGAQFATGTLGPAGDSIFEYGLLEDVDAGGTGNILERRGVNIAASAVPTGATAQTLTLDANLGAALDGANDLLQASALHMPVVDNDKAHFLLGTGSEDGGDISPDTNANGISFASTNTANDGSGAYNRGFIVRSVAGTGVATNENVIAVGKVISATETAQLILGYDKFTGVRPMVIARPFGVVSNITTAVKDAGLKLVVTVTGGGLPAGGIKRTVMELLPNGSFNSGLGAQVVPTDGGQTQLLKLDASNNFQLFSLATLTGANTTIDTRAEALGTGFSLVDEDPALTPGGSLGTTTPNVRGARALYNSLGRAVLLSAAAAGDFTAANNLSANERIRFLFKGCDINNASSAAPAPFALNFSAGLANAVIATTQPITTGFPNAFVDVSTFTEVATPVSIINELALIIHTKALACPSSATIPSVEVQLVDTLGTAAITDDVLHQSIAEVALTGDAGTNVTAATTGFLEPLTTTFSNFALSTFQNTGTTATYIVNDQVTQGAIKTTLASTPTSSVNLVVGTAPAAGDPIGTVCVTENFEGAIPIGDAVRGTPGTLNTTAISRVFLSLTTSSASRLIPNGAGAFPRMFVDGTSIVPTAAIPNTTVNVGAAASGTGANEFRVQLARRVATGALNPSDEMTTICIEGLRVAGTATPLASTDIIARILADDNGGVNVEEVVVGSDAPVTTSTGGSLVAGEVIAANIRGIGTNVESIRQLSFQATATQNSAAQGQAEIQFDDANTAANGASVANYNTFATTGTPRLAGAVVTALDDGSYNLLTDAEDRTSIAVDTTETAVGETLTTVTGLSGVAEAGTQVSLTALNGSPADTVITTVQPDGSFQLGVNVVPGTSLSLQQFPTSAQASSPLQIITLTAEDQVVAPQFIGSITSIPGIIYPNRGKVAVLIDNPTTTGNTVGFDFADFVATAAINGITVEQVGSRFFAIVNAKSPNFALSANGVDGTITLDNSQPRVGRAVNLRTVKTNSSGQIVLKAKSNRKFPSETVVVLINTDGTTATVDGGDLEFSKSRRRIRFTNPDATKTIRVVMTVNGRSVSARTL